MKDFKKGRHVLMIDAELTPDCVGGLVLSYSWKGVSVGGRTTITQLSPSQLPFQPFLESVFSDHSEKNSEENVLSAGGDSIRCVSLFG